MEYRYYGVQLNLDDSVMGVYRYYKEGFKLFELTIPNDGIVKIKNSPEYLDVIKDFIIKNYEINFYLRVPHLSFTGVLDLNQIKELFIFCKDYGFAGLVFKPGEALSADVNHFKEAKYSVVKFMNNYGHLGVNNGVKVYWESSNSGFGSVENIIDMVHKESQTPFRAIFQTKLCLENYVIGKYTLQEACEYATDIFFTDYEGNHSEILKIAKYKPAFVPWGGEGNFKSKLIWEESLTD